MSSEVVVERKCDRCEKVMDSRKVSGESGAHDAVAALADGRDVVLKVTIPGAKEVVFYDLCEKCLKRCLDLLRLVEGNFVTMSKPKKKTADKPK